MLVYKYQSGRDSFGIFGPILVYYESCFDTLCRYNKIDTELLIYIDLTAGSIGYGFVNICG